MRIVLAIVIGIVILNTGLAYYIVFSEDRRDTAASWAWLLALILFPGFGIVAFLFFGRKLSRISIFDQKILEDTGSSQLVAKQKKLIKTESLSVPETVNQGKPYDLISLLMESNQAPLTEGNNLSIIDDGEDKMN